MLKYLQFPRNKLSVFPDNTSYYQPAGAATNKHSTGILNFFSRAIVNQQKFCIQRVSSHKAPILNPFTRRTKLKSALGHSKIRCFWNLNMLSSFPGLRFSDKQYLYSPLYLLDRIIETCWLGVIKRKRTGSPPQALIFGTLINNKCFDRGRRGRGRA